MDVVDERCAGLDVHRDTVVATVRTPAGNGPAPPSGDPHFCDDADAPGRAARVAHRA